jgi:hypothetical protein
MERIIIPVAVCVIILLSAAIAGQYFRHKRILGEKNRGIFRQIYEHDNLKKELERTRIEKETLEQLLKSKLPAD